MKNVKSSVLQFLRDTVVGMFLMLFAIVVAFLWLYVANQPASSGVTATAVITTAAFALAIAYAVKAAFFPQSKNKRKPGKT